MKLLLTALLLLLAMAASAQTCEELKDLGMQAYNNKDYERAAYFYEQAYEQADKADYHLCRSICLSLEMCYHNTGEYAKALEYGRKKVNYDKLDGGDDTLLAFDYLNLAVTCSKMQQREQTYCYLDSASLHINENNAREMTEMYYGMAGIAYGRFSDWARAAESFRVLYEMAKSKPLNNRSLLHANQYGNTLYKLGDYQASYEVFRQQTLWALELYGRDSKEFRWAMYTLANIIAFTGNVEDGCRVYMSVAELYRDKLREQLRVLPSEQREALLGESITVLQSMVAYGLEAQCDGDAFTRQAYESLLLTKGLLLAAERSVDDIVEEYGTSVDRADLARLQQMRARLMRLETSDDRSVEEVATLYADILQLDAEIAVRCSQYGDVSAFMDVDYDAVRRSLGKGEVLLDFAEIPHKQQPREYVCYEIRREYEYPRVHRLCNLGQLDSLLTLEGGERSRLYSGESAVAMEQLIGQRLADIIGKARTVYYVSDGEFYRIAIEAITVDGQPLCEHYSMRCLSSARQLCELSQTGNITGAMVYGGLDYGEGTFRPLPNSGIEASAVAAQIGTAATLVTGSDGTKRRFLLTNFDKVDILHIATHGYFYQSQDATAPASLQGYADAMLRSGLVMARGNVGWGGDGQTGLLSAADIAQCDMRHVRLACIASCHSAEGEVTAEGVFGLQRGFKKAGVQSMVLSLWEVSDAVTGEFMTAFYRELAGSKYDVHKAFERARAEIRTRYSDPYYWAAFVLID
ncbi:MAG: CHAT domain-containing protein [Muribaculaceae bacterium]